MPTLTINEKHVEEKHIAWYAESEGDDVFLYEVVKRKYRHPQALDDAWVTNIEIDHVGTEKKTSGKAAAWILLEAATNAVSFQQTT